MRPTDAAVDPVEHALRGLRTFFLAAALFVVASSWVHDGTTPATIGLAVATGLLLAGENVPWSARGRFERTTRSIAVVTADLVVAVLTVHLVAGEWSSIGLLVLLFPLIEAGVRHGVFGFVASWAAVALFVASTTMISWSGSIGEFRSPAEFAAAVLLVAAPIALLSQRLVDRHVAYERAHRATEQRSTTLAAVLGSAGDVTGSDPDSVLDGLVRAASTLVDGRCSIVRLDPTRAANGRIHEDGDADDDATISFFAVVASERNEIRMRCATRSEIDPFVADGIDVLCAQAAAAWRCAEVSQTARLEAAWWQGRSSIDPLTGLLNRAGIVDHVEAWLSTRAERIALLRIDIDDVSSIDRRHGHGAADEIRRSVAEQLRDPSLGVAGRLTDDGFVVVRPLLAGETVEHLADAVAARVDHCFTLETGEVVSVSGRVGHAVADVDKTSAAGRLLAEAEAMLGESRSAPGRALPPPWPPTRVALAVPSRPGAAS